MPPDGDPVLDLSRNGLGFNHKKCVNMLFKNLHVDTYNMLFKNLHVV